MNSGKIHFCFQVYIEKKEQSKHSLVIIWFSGLCSFVLHLELMSTNRKKNRILLDKQETLPHSHSFIWTFGLCEYSLITASTWVILLFIFYLGETAACGWDSLSPQSLARVCVAEWSFSERCPNPAAASAETLVPEQRMTNDIKSLRWWRSVIVTERRHPTSSKITHLWIHWAVQTSGARDHESVVVGSTALCQVHLGLIRACADEPDSKDYFTFSVTLTRPTWLIYQYKRSDTGPWCSEACTELLWPLCYHVCKLPKQNKTTTYNIFSRPNSEPLQYGSLPCSTAIRWRRIQSKHVT